MMVSASLMSRLKQKCMVLFLAAGMLLGGTTAAQAIDFKATGEWLFGFGLGNAALNGGKGTPKNDIFSASQRIRMQLDAVASENLSGTLFFEIGVQDWGNKDDGAALGADGVIVKVKNAYIDWLVPETDLRLRMGIQALVLPNAAGGSAILDADVAGITANYKFTDEVSLSAFWMRPTNDNFGGSTDRYGRQRKDANYLDNIDIFGLSVPLTFEGIDINPWIAYGIFGRNALRTPYGGLETSDGVLTSTLLANPGHQTQLGGFGSNRAYSSMFFAGLPITVTALDPVNIEFDVNYGYVEGFGRTNVVDYKWNRVRRGETKREGWLIKALVEYKMDWGVPGIFGWYSSGDDGDVKNGSERMPTIAGGGSFTSFMGLAGSDYWANGTKGVFYEKNLSYAGTWGVGLQVRDMTFLEDLSHTFRVAYWGGTNSPDMVKYFNCSADYDLMDGAYDGPYLTTNDGLLEFNLDNTYKIYENLSVSLDLGYIVNMMDRGTWARSWTKNPGNERSFSKHDAWKAQMTFAYTF